MSSNSLHVQDFIKFNSLNPRHHCAGVTRFDLEIVATEVARTVSCRFWHKAHTYCASNARSSIKLDANRERALVSFANLVALQPLDMSSVLESIEPIRECGGDELVIEAIGVATGFSTITKVVDATGKKPMSDSMAFFFFKVVARVMNIFGLQP